MQLLVRHLGLADAIDRELHLLKRHLPYFESDHVLNLTYNVLAGGTCSQDLERLRTDETYLDALGAPRIPDPTTAGDFLRRFSAPEIDTLQGIINDKRVQVWQRQPAAFLEHAIIEADGTLVGTTGECRQGMDLSYNGVWGYHPLVVSLANTQEPLFIINRPASRPSYEGAAAYLDRAAALCRQAGFRNISFRGRTARGSRRRGLTSAPPPPTTRTRPAGAGGRRGSSTASPSRRTGSNPRATRHVAVSVIRRIVPGPSVAPGRGAPGGGRGSEELVRPLVRPGGRRVRRRLGTIRASPQKDEKINKRLDGCLLGG